MGSLAERLVVVVTVGFEEKMEHTGIGCLSLWLSGKSCEWVISHMTGMSDSLTLGWDWLTILPTLGSLDTQVVDLEYSSLHNVCKDELFGQGFHELVVGRWLHPQSQHGTDMIWTLMGEHHYQLWLGHDRMMDGGHSSVVMRKQPSDLVTMVLDIRMGIFLFAKVRPWGIRLDWFLAVLNSVHRAMKLYTVLYLGKLME